MTQKLDSPSWGVYVETWRSGGISKGVSRGEEAEVDGSKEECLFGPDAPQLGRT
jgi:hypothetical protein